MIRVFICTAVFNDLGHTKKFLASVKKQTYPYLTTIILDDGSTDDTVNYLESHHPEVVLIKSKGNNWWTGGLNLAITKALELGSDKDFVLTINNDCTFDKNYITSIISSSGSNGGCIVGSIEKDDQSKLVNTGLVNMDWMSGKWSNKKNLLAPVFAQYHTTKGTLIPIRAIRSVGLLDEKHLPHYASDIEYTHRLVLAGYKLLIDPSSIVYCDQKRTGIIPKSHKSIKDLFQLAFSRKSTINLIDHYYLIRLTCPHNLKTINYLRLIGKTFYLFKQAIWR